jgi:hypothetical protein
MWTAVDMAGMLYDPACVVISPTPCVSVSVSAAGQLTFVSLALQVVAPVGQIRTPPV